MKERIGEYALIATIGDGAQGKVFKARNLSNDNPNIPRDAIVAVKVLAGTVGDPLSESRFQSQSGVLRSISHPGLVRYLDSFVWNPGEWDEARCLVMEFMEGETLADRLKKNPKGLPWPEVKQIFTQCLGGLIEARKQGLIHRDLKPSNIFLTNDGQAKCFDFDIARREGEEQASTVGWKGTFNYMAPDFVHVPDFHGDEVSDIFSLGVCFCQALTGQLPFDALGDGAHIGYMNRWRGEQGGPKPSLRAGVFRVLAHAKSFVTRCIETKRSDRFQSFREMLVALEAVHYRSIEHKGKDGYELRALLGRGGFGEVFSAVRLSDGRPVAVKHLFSDRQSTRFVKEAQIVKNCSHPHTVEYIDFMTVRGTGREEQYFLVLELLDGMPEAGLRYRIKHEGRLDLNEALVMFANYLDALAFLHEGERPIIHRDIKPTNLYAPAGHPEKAKIFDLGVARDVTGTATSGGVPGTLDYMAPEFAKPGNDRGSPQSDIYALGLCLYEVVTGQPAFPRLPADINASWLEFQKRSLGARIRYDHRVFEIFPELRKILEKALHTDPEKRYARATTMREDLLRLNAILQERLADGQEGDGDAPTVAAVDYHLREERVAPVGKKPAAPPARPKRQEEAEAPEADTGKTRMIRSSDVAWAKQHRKRKNVWPRAVGAAAAVSLLAYGAFWVWTHPSLLRRAGWGDVTVGPSAAGAPRVASSAAPAVPVITRKPFPQGLPEAGQVGEVRQDHRRLVSELARHPDSDELKRAISEIEDYAKTIPGLVDEAFEETLSSGNREALERRINAWLDLADYKELMGLSQPAFLERTSAMRARMEIMAFNQELDALAARAPRAISDDPAEIVRADKLALDCKRLASSDWPGINPAEKERRLQKIRELESKLAAAITVLVTTLKDKAVADCASGNTESPARSNLKSLDHVAANLVALARKDYDQAIKAADAAFAGRFARVRDDLLARIGAAAGAADLAALAEPLVNWRSLADKPPATMVQQVEKALGDRYTTLAAALFASAEAAYLKRDTAAGDRGLKGLRDFLAASDGRYGKPALKDMVSRLEDLRDRTQAEIAAASKPKPEPKPEPKTEPEPKPPVVAVTPEPKPEPPPPVVAVTPQPEPKPVPPAPEPSRGTAPGILRIMTSPGKARVFVDDVPVESGIVKVDPAKTHKVKVELDGYETYEQYYRVDPGEEKVIDVLLKKAGKKRGLFGF